MMNHVIVFSNVDRQKILDCLDNLAEITDWHASTGAIFLEMEKTPGWLTTKLHDKLPDARFIIVPLDIEETQGWTAKSTWEALERKIITAFFSFLAFLA